jgi:hypothetical protein
VHVFQPKTGEVYRRIAIRHVVLIGIGIEEKVGRVHHPDTAFSGQGGGGDVQAADKVLRGLEIAIAVGVFEDGDAILALDVVRRRGRRPVLILYAPVHVVSGDLKALGEGILPVLHDPHAPALVEGEVDRLRDERFLGAEGDLDVFRSREARLRPRGLFGARKRHNQTRHCEESATKQSGRGERPGD